MPLARIVASNPASARYTARTLHEAGYEVEIVPPGSPANSTAELVFDVDADKMISQSTDRYVPGEREFVLKPLWRKFNAKRKADEDVARAQRARRNWTPVQRERYESARVAAPAAPERHEERAPRASVQQEARRVEAIRVQRLREEQEAAHLRVLEEQHAELRRQEQARQLELTRKQEYEEQQMILRKQEEERQRAEALHQQQEAEAAEGARQMQIAQEREASREVQVAQEREARMRQDAMLRQAEEQHRDDVMRQRREEELSRRAETQRLLLEANKRREESIRERGSAPVIAPQSIIGSVPTLREYFVLRMVQWRQSRAARQSKSRANVTRIDRSGRSAWRQAWPITAGVAAACLVGWGIAAYHESAPQSVEAPPILSPGQYAPYPVANPPANTAAKRTVTHPQTRPKPSAVHRADVADDEVVVHHYYPAKGVTAQNRAPQRAKKITDLQ